MVAVAVALLTVAVVVNGSVRLVRHVRVGLLQVVVAHVGQNAVLDVASQQALLRERHGVLARVVSPAVHPAEKQGSVHLLGHVLVQVVLKKLFLRTCTLLHLARLSLFII